MFEIVKVRGMSMHPTLAPGDYLILTKARSQMKHLRAGFVVVVDHPKFGIIVKRIKSRGANHIRLIGDGTTSTDSDRLGDIRLSWIKGRVRLIITPKGIRRL